MLKKKLPMLLIILVASLSFVSCFEDRDDALRTLSPEELDLEISDFIYRGLNYWSLYKADVPELANDFFDSDAERLEFLRQFDSPEATFEALLSPVDRFSVLRDDYIEFENALAGIRLSNGMQFSLARNPSNENEVFGFVRYVVNNSPAEAAGVQRGILFNSVDGTVLQADSDFNALLGPDTYTIDLASYDGTSFISTGESITLTKIELTINPVHTTRVIEVGDRTVGYLHYTGFTNEFDPQLNAAFGDFQAAGVTDLVLDLRYNGGGSIETSNDLSSMVTGQFDGQLFIQQEYNADRAAENNRNRLFNNEIAGGENINSLNLNRVYVLTTGRTASASELILSGLAPYIDIVQIGTSTTGKFEGSFLLYDAPAPNFNRSQANPNHRYVMLPLVLRSVNAAGLTDYRDGFTPDITIAENFTNLGELGDVEEPLLAAALNDMGVTRNAGPLKYHTEALEILLDEEESSPLYQQMFVEELE